MCLPEVLKEWSISTKSEILRGIYLNNFGIIPKFDEEYITRVVQILIPNLMRSSSYNRLPAEHEYLMDSSGWVVRWVVSILFLCTSESLQQEWNNFIVISWFQFMPWESILGKESSHEYWNRSQNFTWLLTGWRCIWYFLVAINFYYQTTDLRLLLALSIWPLVCTICSAKQPLGWMIEKTPLK